MINTLTDRTGERERYSAQQNDHPLNQAIERMHNSIRETQKEYESNLNHKDHYTNVNRRRNL